MSFGEKTTKDKIKKARDTSTYRGCSHPENNKPFRRREYESVCRNERSGEGTEDPEASNYLCVVEWEYS
jgi:hypothetical protein